MELHKNLSPENLHEAKHIASATSADIGKVLTPTAAAGVGELRFLKASELNWGVTLTTADHHKVAFPSSITAGTFEFRQVTFPDLDATGYCTYAADGNKVLGPSRTENGKMVLKRITNTEVDHSQDVMLNFIGLESTAVAVTAAVDPTLNTITDFIAYPFPITLADSENLTYDSGTKTITVNAGVPTQKIKLSISAALSASVNTAKAAIAYVINGTLVPNRFTVYGKTAGDWMIGTRHRIIEVHAGDTIQIVLASTVSCNLTQCDISIAATRVATE